MNNLKDAFWNRARTDFSARIWIKALSVDKEWSFPAYITGFSDTYQPNWESVNVFGRIDPIRTYSTTSRQITLSFDVVSEDAYQARDNWVKLNEIAQAQYATYTQKDQEEVITTPPIFGLKLHNLAREVNTGSKLRDYLYGVFSGNFSIAPFIEEGYAYGGNIVRENWNTPGKAHERQIHTENFNGVYIFPKSYKVDLTFDVIHSVFRGNRGRLESPGGPAVSMTVEQLDSAVESRTYQHEANSIARNMELYLQQMNQNRNNKKLGK